MEMEEDGVYSSVDLRMQNHDDSNNVGEKSPRDANLGKNL
jgi:hypothetical protein